MGDVKNYGGYTLIEIIIAILVTGLLASFLFSPISTVARSYLALNNWADLYSEASTALERMSREIRDAETVTVLSTQKIRILKANPTQQDTNLYVTFMLAGGSLQRGSSATATEPTNYTVLASRCLAFTVGQAGQEITLVLTLGSGGDTSVTLRTKICPKNLPFGGTAYAGRNFNGYWQEMIQ